MHSLSLLDDPGSRTTPAVGTGQIVDDETEEWWESWRKRQRIEGGYVRGGKKRDVGSENEVVRRGRTNITLPSHEEGADSAGKDGGSDEELRILIKVRRLLTAVFLCASCPDLVAVGHHGWIDETGRSV